MAQQPSLRMDEVLNQVIQNETPTSDEQDAKNRLFNRINNIVKGGLCQYVGLHVKHYGSFTSGLSSPSSDLDLTIEGCLVLNNSLYDDHHGWPEYGLDYGLEGLKTSDLEVDQKMALFKDLQYQLKNSQAISYNPHQARIIRARIPVLKFLDSYSDLECDVAIGNTNALFKSKVLKQLALKDTRFPTLLRLVKAWARRQNILDGSQGLLNSHCLTLLVIYHLQTYDFPLLPPLSWLFGYPTNSKQKFEQRPLHEGQPAAEHLLQLCSENLEIWRPQGTDPQLTFCELLLEFWRFCGNFFASWAEGSDMSRRISTWEGRMTTAKWPSRNRPCCISVEDPFDATDNAGRTVDHHGLHLISSCFTEATQITEGLLDGWGHSTIEDFEDLFLPPEQRTCNCNYMCEEEDDTSEEEDTEEEDMYHNNYNMHDQNKYCFM